jgi:hypothetical protein
MENMTPTGILRTNKKRLLPITLKQYVVFQCVREEVIDAEHARFLKIYLQLNMHSFQK